MRSCTYSKKVPKQCHSPCIHSRAACITCGVEAVVYTSTFNVVFGGQEIVEGREEDLPYFPLDKVRGHMLQLPEVMC